MPVGRSLCSSRMTIELRHLLAFLAIADEGTLTRAATRLHLTQPALSRTLAQLEKHLGARLVDRSTHHLELTGRGHAFRAKAFLARAVSNTSRRALNHIPRPGSRACRSGTT